MDARMSLVKRLACWAFGGAVALVGLWLVTRFLA
jgi:hypothetical protein